jgi:hypothetical protein
VTIVTETSAPTGDAMSQLLAPNQPIEAVDGVSDPDGNGWLLQEVKTRAPGR